jgi:glycosyltransferase involved in cell wall biosynthesis
MKTPTYSIVVPLFNESESLPEFIARTTAVMDGLGQPWELIMVDDGSRDTTAQILLEHAAKASARSCSPATSATRSPSPPGWTTPAAPPSF